MVLDPPAFAAAVADGREGWIALHAHQLTLASERLPAGVGRARAEWSLAVLHADLARVEARAWQTLFDTWDRRRGLPEGSGAPLVALLAARCAPTDDATEVGRWTARLAAADRAVGNAVAEAADPRRVDVAGPLGARLALHREVLADPGSLERLAAAGAVPMLTERADTYDRAFYDPCLHRTLAEAWTRRASGSVHPETAGADPAVAFGEAGLRGILFSAWLRAVPRAHDPSVAAAGDDGPGNGVLVDSGGDDPQEAREAVRRLDTVLGGWGADLASAADADGLAILADLDPVGRYRQEWLVVQARTLLLADRPRTAAAVRELARDPARKPGPGTSPHLLALIAEVDLARGRPREAVDALQALAEVHPEVSGLRETVGDLAVLLGLDRGGDSREE